MNEIMRYVIQMYNGSYLKEEYFGSLERIKIHTSDNPIDATLFKTKGSAERALKQIIAGTGTLPVHFDDDNLPMKVVELKIIHSVN